MSDQLLRRRYFFGTAVKTELYLSTSSTENTEEALSMTYNAAARTTSFYLWTDSELICDSGVSVLGYTGQYNSVTYASDTGKITAEISRNTDTGNTKSGSFTISYNGQTLTFQMTQSKDAVESNSTEEKYTYNNDMTLGGFTHYTQTTTNPNRYVWKYTTGSFSMNKQTCTTTKYISGNTSKGSWTDEGTVTLTMRTDLSVCYMNSDGTGTVGITYDTTNWTRSDGGAYQITRNESNSSQLTSAGSYTISVKHYESPNALGTLKTITVHWDGTYTPNSVTVS